MLLAVGMLLTRLVAAPTGAGIRPVMAAATGGGLFVATATALHLRSPDGSDRVVGALPATDPLSLAALNQTLVLGSGPGLHISHDGGRSWRAAAGVAGRRFLAVAAAPGMLAAAAWGDRLWVSRDGGGTWSAALLPPGDTEVESLSLGAGVSMAATLLGVLASTDSGATWRHVPGTGDRMTAVSQSSGGTYAAGWRGDVYRYSAGVFTPLRVLGAAVWQVIGDAPLAATTTGLFDGAASVPGPLAGREVTGLASSAGWDYALVAGGRLYTRPRGLTTWVDLGQV